jgi:hypothetical protein
MGEVLKRRPTLGRVPISAFCLAMIAMASSFMSDGQR